MSSKSTFSYIFTHPSVIKRSDPNSLGLYEIGNRFSNTNIIEEEDAYKIMRNSIFYLNIEYKRGIREVEINYNKIAVIENNSERILNLSIKDIKEIRAEDINLNLNYLNFIKFLNIFESALKEKYRKDNKIEIELKFNLDHPERDIYKLRCLYTIKNIALEETQFKDEDILNKNDYIGLFFMIQLLSDD